jgi:haloalkane dehalogenase
MVPFQRSCIEIEGHRLHWMEAGQGRPVLLLHGNPTWSFLWRKVAAALEGEPLRLVMPDLLGLGLSDKPRDSSFHQLRTHARVVGEFIDALGLAELIFVGQDWGGPIGLLALAYRPERASGLVLLNTIADPPRADARPTAFHRLARWPVVSEIVFRLLGYPLNVLATAQGDPSSIRGDVARAYRWPLRHIVDRVAPLALARVAAEGFGARQWIVPDFPGPSTIDGLRKCQTFLQAFSGPSAIVWGERDPILGRKLRRLERLLPQAAVTRTQAGHFLQEEVPEVIAGAVRDVARRAELTNQAEG